MIDSVSVVIATFDRHAHCKRAIDSVLSQTHAPLEVIVVDDGSSPPFQDDRVLVVRTPANTRNLFGWPSPGYVRTLGMKRAKGDYIAFLDDDDVWLPTKLEMQLALLKKEGVGACCSEAKIGKGVYDANTPYLRMMSDHHFDEIGWCLSRRGYTLGSAFPTRFTHDLLTKHNLVITSSVLARKDLLEKIGFMQSVPLGQEDYGCWLELSKHTDFAYLSTPSLYYDSTPSTNR